MYLTASITISIFFFFNDTATTEIYTLSLHDALPICMVLSTQASLPLETVAQAARLTPGHGPLWFQLYLQHDRDRKSTRLNSSHSQISYAVFCLKKKNSRASPHMARHNIAELTMWKPD